MLIQVAGFGADQLSGWVGVKATVQWRLAKDPVFAISGESMLLRNGAIKVSDDRILHPHGRRHRPRHRQRAAAGHQQGASAVAATRWSSWPGC